MTSQEELDLDSSQIETEEATNGGSQSHSESVNLKVINSKTDRSVKTPDIVMQLIDKSNYRLFNPLQAGKYQALTGAKYPRLKWGKKSVKWPHNCFEQALKADDEPIYICKACGSVYKHPGCTGGGAGSTKYHAERCEQLNPLLSMSLSTSTQSLLLFAKDKARDKEEIQDLFVKWNASSGHSFNAIENPYLREIWTRLRVIHPLPHRKTLKEWVTRQAMTIRFTLARSMQDANTRINLCLDAWTSPFNVAYLGIVAHYIDKDWVMQERMLAFVELPIGHAGNITATYVLQVLNDFGIRECLGTITTDNASDNSTFVEHLAKDIPASRDWVGSQNHLRCVAHIVNLSAQQLLSGLKANAPESNDDYGPIDDEFSSVDVDVGAINAVSQVLRRIRKIVKFICSSPQREHQFIGIQTSAGFKKAYKLVKDVATRWNSTYFMLERFQQLREVLTLYIAKAVREKQMDKKLQLVEGDWDIIKTLLQLLEPFEIISRRMSRTKEPTIQHVWPCYLFLFTRLEKWLIANKDNQEPTCVEIHGSVDAAYVKLKNYYIKTDEVPWFGIACILDPFMKLQSLASEDFHADDYLENLKLFYDEMERNSNLTTQSSNTDVAEEALGGSHGLDHAKQALSRFQREEAFIRAVMGNTRPLKPKKSEIERYLEDDPSGPEWLERNTLRWWKLNHTRFPILSEMARAVLSQVASSVSSERSFNMARDIHNYRRGRLDESTISDLVLVKFACAQEIWNNKEADEHYLGSQTMEDYIEELRRKAEALEEEAGAGDVLQDIRLIEPTQSQSRSQASQTLQQPSGKGPQAPKRKTDDRWTLDPGPVKRKRAPFQESSLTEPCSTTQESIELQFTVMESL